MLKFGWSLGVFLAFAFKYVVVVKSDGCFKKEDEDWGVWYGNCTGSAVLVVPTQELFAIVNGDKVNKLAQDLTYSFGGCTMKVSYSPQLNTFTYDGITLDFPLNFTVTPEKITLKSNKITTVDCSSTPVLFEKISDGNKIAIDYKPDNLSETYFTTKYNASLYQGPPEGTTDIAWILFIVGSVLLVLLSIGVIVLVVFLVRLKKANKDLDEQQPIGTSVNDTNLTAALENENLKITPTTGGNKTPAILPNTMEPNKAHPRTAEDAIKTADLRTAEPKVSAENVLRPRTFPLDAKAKYIAEGHKVGMDDYPTMADVVSDFDATVTAQEATKAKSAEKKAKSAEKKAKSAEKTKKLKRTTSNENFTFNTNKKPLRSQEKKAIGRIN
ncbi:hypothetical protein M3Y94_01207100 [Aphelenchoides besseyi]|nr:hypothetical protein M3Y94_01207100 [Aphelenchoides besseyi]KAI6228493.1 hypothetical protein M3Y95_00628100 [Aphelenchoides besseyi]